jgi:hypothetical protein
LETELWRMKRWMDDDEGEGGRWLKSCEAENWRTMSCPGEDGVVGLDDECRRSRLLRPPASAPLLVAVVGEGLAATASADGGEATVPTGGT